MQDAFTSQSWLAAHRLGNQSSRCCRRPKGAEGARHSCVIAPPLPQRPLPSPTSCPQQRQRRLAPESTFHTSDAATSLSQGDTPRALGRAVATRLTLILATHSGSGPARTRPRQLAAPRSCHFPIPHAFLDIHSSFVNNDMAAVFAVPPQSHNKTNTQRDSDTGAAQSAMSSSGEA